MNHADQVSLQINATIGREASKLVTGIEAKVKASMRAVIAGNWLASTDEALIRAGIGGALLDVGEQSEDGQKIARTLRAMNQIGAMILAARAGLTYA